MLRHCHLDFKLYFSLLQCFQCVLFKWNQYRKKDFIDQLNHSADEDKKWCMVYVYVVKFMVIWAHFTLVTTHDVLFGLDINAHYHV